MHRDRSVSINSTRSIELSVSCEGSEVIEDQGKHRNTLHWTGLNGSGRKTFDYSAIDRPDLMDQSTLPRPCYYMLRVLGAWQPKKRAWMCRPYTVFAYLILFMSIALILALDYVHWDRPGKKMQWHWREIVNSCCTIFNLACPFIFIKYYFNFGNYDNIIRSVLEGSNQANTNKILCLSRIYTLISVLLWVLSAAFFYVHWVPFFKEIWHFVLYFVTVLYTTGWWAAWLSIYGYVCHLHTLQAQIFIENMQEHYKNSDRSSETEKRCVGELLSEYNEIQRWIERTQHDFGKIISFAIAYHVIDIVVFTIAFWHADFGEKYSLWQFVGGVGFDLASIALKLGPTAVVSGAVHRMTRRAGKECYPDPFAQGMPSERMIFYQHLSLREQDLGLRILGVKISVRIAVGIFVTIVTALATFLRFAIPFSYL